MAYIPFLSFLLVLALPLAVSFVDYIGVLRSRRIVSRKRYHNAEYACDDFTILIPIFGDINYLKNVPFLKQYHDHVLLCTTTKESAEFNAKIDQIARENNFRVFRSNVPLASASHTSNPINSLIPLQEQILPFNKDLARDEVIKDSFSVVTTKYSLFLDGDTHTYEDLHNLVGQMILKDFDVASVRVVVARQKTLIQKLQAIEYELAMDSRRIYPWLTSGAATLAKTTVLKDIMHHHSLYFQGGDIEVGRLAIMLDHQVGHIPFTFYTDVPSTFRTWWKQRAGWFGGGFRHAVVNLHSHGWKYPLFSFYNTVLVFLALPLRWYEIVSKPAVLPLVIFLYWILIGLFHWRQLRWYYLLFPLYALLQILFLVPIGVYTYFKMSFRSENIGLIKLRYQPSA